MIGRHLPSQPSMLHLNDCKLPCWIGIIPGQATVANAKERITRIYGNSSIYSLKFMDNVWKITDNKSKEQVEIVVNSLTGISDFAVTKDLLISYRNSAGSGIPYGDLYNVLGIPDEVILSSPDDAPYPILRYQTQRIHVALDQVIQKGQCGRVVPNSPVNYFALYDTQQSNYAWVSDPFPWHGFRECYRFLR